MLKCEFARELTNCRCWCVCIEVVVRLVRGLLASRRQKQIFELAWPIKIPKPNRGANTYSCDAQKNSRQRSAAHQQVPQSPPNVAWLCGPWKFHGHTGFYWESNELMGISWAMCVCECVCVCVVGGLEESAWNCSGNCLGQLHYNFELPALVCASCLE